VNNRVPFKVNFTTPPSMLPILKLHHLNFGIRKSLKFLTCTFGDAMPMCMYKKISGLAFTLTFNNASSLVIFQIMLVGDSVTRKIVISEHAEFDERYFFALK
jgi:hypothetical protein